MTAGIQPVCWLNEITIIDSVFDGFWMKTAYRIPDTPCGCVEPGTTPKATIPINRFTVRSFITNVTDGAKLKPGATTLKGIAFDGGKGIKEVAVSLDGGHSWTPAKLGKDLGKYSFREEAAGEVLGRPWRREPAASTVGAAAITSVHVSGRSRKVYWGRHRVCTTIPAHHGLDSSDAF
jgi:hypothetical protein